ncbi:MAG: hypothetical protein K0Q85_1467 [Caproiciproducens sp.]|nr:hypothetical protein [Caproiciproducens sp.]
MKFLYASVEPDQSDLLCDKIGSQILGVRQLGNIAEGACIHGDELLYCTKDGITRFPLPVSASNREETACRLICDCIEKNQYDYVYLRGFLINRTLLKIASCAKTKKFGAKVIFEEMRFPLRDTCRELLQTYKDSGNLKEHQKLRSEMIHHSLLKSKFSGVVDTIVVFGVPTEHVWGIPSITVDSGIDVSTIKCRTNTEAHGDSISILGVVENPKICGYDRVIRGLKAYQTNVRRDKVVFDIVGDDADVRELKEMVQENQLTDCVRFLGKKSIDEMGELYDSHTVAVSCMGLYRIDGSYFSSHSTKQYCAAGIPFVYAYEDLCLDNNTPFALKLANNDSPINIALIGEFVWRCRLNQRLTLTERKFAEKHYDWRVIMKRILEFTATGRREV